MRVSAKVDYALRAVIELAAIGKATGRPPPYTSVAAHHSRSQMLSPQRGGQRNRPELLRESMRHRIGPWAASHASNPVRHGTGVTLASAERPRPPRRRR